MEAQRISLLEQQLRQTNHLLASTQKERDDFERALLKSESDLKLYSLKAEHHIECAKDSLLDISSQRSDVEGELLRVRRQVRTLDETVMELGQQLDEERNRRYELIRMKEEHEANKSLLTTLTTKNEELSDQLDSLKVIHHQTMQTNQTILLSISKYLAPHVGDLSFLRDPLLSRSQNYFLDKTHEASSKIEEFMEIASRERATLKMEVERSNHDLLKSKSKTRDFRVRNVALQEELQNLRNDLEDSTSMNLKMKEQKKYFLMEQDQLDELQRDRDRMEGELSNIQSLLKDRTRALFKETSIRKDMEQEKRELSEKLFTLETERFSGPRRRKRTSDHRDSNESLHEDRILKQISKLSRATESISTDHRSDLLLHLSSGSAKSSTSFGGNLQMDDLASPSKRAEEERRVEILEEAEKRISQLKDLNEELELENEVLRERIETPQHPHANSETFKEKKLLKIIQLLGRRLSESTEQILILEKEKVEWKELNTRIQERIA